MANSSAPIPEWLYAGEILGNTCLCSSINSTELPESIQLVLTSPPDLIETSHSTWPQLFEMYQIVFGRCVRALRGNGVFCVIITDRKWKGQIVRKHESVSAIADRLGLTLFAHKILIRTTKVDLYRLGFSHILCFRQRNNSHKKSRNYESTQFRRDLWGPFDRVMNLPVSRSSFAPQAIRMLIEAFTDRGDLILDPFCGTGITQRVALGLGRNAKGYEIDSKMESFWQELSTNRSLVSESGQ